MVNKLYRKTRFGLVEIGARQEPLQYKPANLETRVRWRAKRFDLELRQRGKYELINHKDLAIRRGRLEELWKFLHDPDEMKKEAIRVYKEIYDTIAGGTPIEGTALHDKMVRQKIQMWRSKHPQTPTNKLIGIFRELCRMAEMEIPDEPEEEREPEWDHQEDMIDPRDEPLCLSLNFDDVEEEDEE